MILISISLFVMYVLLWYVTKKLITKYFNKDADNESVSEELEGEPMKDLVDNKRLEGGLVSKYLVALLFVKETVSCCAVYFLFS